MGAWTWLDRQLERLLEQAGTAVPRAAYVGRPASPSPAGGFHADHDADQARVVAEALGLPAAAAARPRWSHVPLPRGKASSGLTLDGNPLLRE